MRMCHVSVADLLMDTSLSERLGDLGLEVHAADVSASPPVSFTIGDELLFDSAT